MTENEEQADKRVKKVKMNWKKLLQKYSVFGFYSNSWIVWNE